MLVWKGNGKGTTTSTTDNNEHLCIVDSMAMARIHSEPSESFHTGVCQGNYEVQ